MSKANNARWLGDKYQRYVLWDKICDMLLEPEKINRVYYEYDEVKSFDDVVVEYKEPQDDLDGKGYTKEYFQVKYHVVQDDNITLENLMKPIFINASKNSYLLKLKNAYEERKDDIDKCKFILYTPYEIKQDNCIKPLISNDNHEWRLETLFDGREKSKMAQIRKKMCEHMSVNEDELKVILSSSYIKHSQPTMDNLIDRINNKLIRLDLKTIDRNNEKEDYNDIAVRWAEKGKGEFGCGDVWDIIKKRKLFRKSVSRKTIQVQSFPLHDNQLDVDYFLDLTKYFGTESGERFLKRSFDWNKTITQELEAFKKRILIEDQSCKGDKQYEMNFATHLSIGFCMGYLFDSKTGLPIYPMQKEFDGTRCWIHERDKYTEWDCGKIERISMKKGNGSALVLNISNEILDNVKEYIREMKLPIGNLYNFTLEKIGNDAIKGGNHVWGMVQNIRNEMKNRTHDEKKGTLHIFASVPIAFMFVLGQQAKPFGRMQIYEFDFENRDTCSYLPSIRLPLNEN